MSRSIHTTRKTLSEIADRKFASIKEQAQAMNKARRQLRRKRRIKRQVVGERRRKDPPLVGVDSATIPIQVHNAGPYVHHNASIEDLRAVLKMLPEAATEGISSIKLILGKEYIDETHEDAEEGRDPFTGRLSYQTLPGVYSGLYLGIYSPRSGWIELYADVYDGSKLPLARNICELYLKLRALKTFVHEIAHHHDATNRVRRGRWLADRKENVEWYAEKMEHEWTRQFVLTYLEKAYPNDVKDLIDFVEHRGGLRVPLEFFSGDSRRTERNGLIRLVLSTDGAFESWVKELPKCADLAASRLAFAWELHFADDYQGCLHVLNRVLTEKPDSIPALTCKGDTLIHLEQFDEAFSIAGRVLLSEPANGEAWEIRGDVFERRRDWPGLLENSDRWLASVPEDSPSRFYAFQHLAIAFCALGDMEKMEVWIEAWSNFGNRKRNSGLIRKAVFRRAGRGLPKSL